MRVPQNVIIVWTGTNAAIPSGWTRETTLDSKYLKATAASTNPNDTGGATTHTHTSPAHSHTLGAHTHTYTTSIATGNSAENQTTQVANDIQANDHEHTGTSGASNGGTTATTAVTYGAFSNDPPYYTVIYIKSSGGASTTTGCVVFTASSSSFTGWQLSNGTNSTPDLRTKYLKGASTGADSGGTGGTFTDSHDITHTHTTNTHTHDAAASGGSGGSSRDGQPGTGRIRKDHTHSVALEAGTQALNQNADTLVTAETVEPAYKKLVALCSTGSTVVYKGMIGMWLGTLATIPGGWALCDGTNGTPDMRDKFLKIANTTGEIGNTGGSNTHTHAAQAHSHTSNGTHTHTAPALSHTSAIAQNGSGVDIAILANDHAAFTSAASTGTYASANTTADSSDNQPPFRTVAFIQLITAGGGGFLLNFV